MKKIISLLLFAFCFCFALNFNEQINDEAHIFSQNERDELLNLVQNFEQNSTTQIAIVTLNSLENKSIEELSLEIARGYKLGQKEDSNGVLLVVAPNEKKVRIEVGYGLEGVLTDAVASEIINSVMIPEFNERRRKRGRFCLYICGIFFIFKDVFNRNSQGGSVSMGFRRSGSGSNGGGASGG